MSLTTIIAPSLDCVSPIISNVLWSNRRSRNFPRGNGFLWGSRRSIDTVSTGEYAKRRGRWLMSRLLSSAVIIGGMLAASAPAFAQQGLPAGRWVHPGGGMAHGGRQGGRSGGSGAPANSAASGVAAAAPAQSAGFGAARTPAPAPVGGVTGPSF